MDQNGREVAGTRTRGKTDCGEVANAQTYEHDFNLDVARHGLQFGPFHAAYKHTHKALFMWKPRGPLHHNSLQGLVPHSCVQSHLHSKALLVSVRKVFQDK